jgi:hypothetical protein
VAAFLPAVRIIHPWRHERFAVNTQGGSPVRESRPPGFVRGALRNECPYHDRFAENRRNVLNNLVGRRQRILSWRKAAPSLLISADYKRLDRTDFAFSVRGIPFREVSPYGAELDSASRSAIVLWIAATRRRQLRFLEASAVGPVGKLNGGDDTKADVESLGYEHRITPEHSPAPGSSDTMPAFQLRLTRRVEFDGSRGSLHLPFYRNPDSGNGHAGLPSISVLTI